MKTIGILGGMGPLATLDLFNKIVCNTNAKKDQDHHSIVIYNNPQIPPRAYPLDNKGNADLVQELIRSAQVLESAGADFIIMPCNTAHIWLDELKKNVAVPFYSIIENTAQHLLENKAIRNGKILLLATDETIRARLYQNAFGNSSYSIVVPKAEEQQLVNRAIKEVKKGNITTNMYAHDLNNFIKNYEKNQISIVLGGCTEIPLLFPFMDTNMMMIDPTLLLAQLAIHKATIP